MLSLAALFSFQRISLAIESNKLQWSLQAGLVLIDHFINRHVDISGADSQCALEHMLQSFSCVIRHLSALDSEFSHQFLDPVFCTMNLPLSANRFTDHYLLT